MIPLHRSWRWLPLVRDSLLTLRGHCAIIVSDVDEHDATLARLRDEFEADDDIAFVGARDVAPGWVAHANDLLARASTPLVMWLPHDDVIDETWIIEAERALDAHPSAIAACGPLVASAHSEPHLAVGLDPDETFTRRSRARRVVHAVDALERGDPALLGILYRAVVRRERNPALPSRGELGVWSDAFWALELVSRGPIVITSARYAKTWHSESTIFTWTDPREDPAHLQRDVDRLVRRLPWASRAVVARAIRRQRRNAQEAP